MDASDEVLVLPYGDIDVSAAARHDRDGLLDAARERSAGGLAGIDVDDQRRDRPAERLPQRRRRSERPTPDETVIVGDKLFDATRRRSPTSPAAAWS